MTTFYWHVHHESLIEPLTEPIENRIAYIKARKPKREVATRLRWMTPLQGKLPVALVKPWAAYGKALAAYDNVRAAYDNAARAAYDNVRAAYDNVRAAHDKAWAAYYKAWAAAMPALEALHAKEHPGCPWDGRTIFPNKAQR